MTHILILIISKIDYYVYKIKNIQIKNLVFCKYEIKKMNLIGFYYHAKEMKIDFFRSKL